MAYLLPVALVIVLILRAKLEQFMNYKAFFCIVVFFILTGCATQEDPVSTREPTTLLTKDDYEDLKVKPRKEEPVYVDYKKEGIYRKNIKTIKKISAEEANQLKFVDAAAFGSVDDLKIRYEKGAKVNFRNNDGETALLKVLEGPYDNGTFIKLKYLISIGAGVNFRGRSATSDITTPLNSAVWNTSIVFKSNRASNKPYFAEQILIYLIDQGASVSGTDEKGRTPLHTAAKSDNLIAARLLLESGAEVTTEDIIGKTPLDFAESGEMIRFLKEHGAKKGTPRQSAESPKNHETEQESSQRADYNKKKPMTNPNPLNPFK